MHESDRTVARVARVGSALVAAAFVFAAARPAGAYCLATTVHAPSGYNAAVNGCIAEGTPLQWPIEQVSYQLQVQASSQVTLAAATAIADRSFAKWTAVSCGTSEAGASQPPSVSLVDLGPTDAGFVPCEGGDCADEAKSTPHVILFRDDSWPYSDPVSTLALTTVTYGVDHGDILGAAMEINATLPAHVLSTTSVVPDEAGVFPDSTYSLEAIMTHEAGHFIGMAHSQIETAVMYAFYQPNAVELTDDDISGVCDDYPPSRVISSNTSSGGCAIESGSAGKTGGTGLAAMAVVAGAVVAYGRRRRSKRSA